MIFNPESIVIMIMALMIGGKILLVTFRSKEISAKYFVLILLFVMFWTISVALATAETEMNQSYRYILISHFLAIPISLSFVNFAYYYLKSKNNFLIVIWSIISTILSFVFIFKTKLIIESLSYSSIYSMWVWNIGKGFYWYVLVFISHIILGLYLLYRKWNSGDNKKSTATLIIGFSVGFIPPLISCIILPSQSIFGYNWLGPSSALIWTLIISYGIYRHKLFSTKILIIELSIFSVWLMVLSHTLLGISTREIITESVLLSAIIILSLLLMNSLETQKKLKTLLTKADVDIDNIKNQIVGK